MTLLCDLSNSEDGMPIHSSTVQRIFDLRWDESDYGSDQNEDLVDNILALLDDRSSIFPTDFPRYSPSSELLTPGIKKWVEGLPGYVVTSGRGDTNLFSTPRNSKNFHSPTYSKSSLQESSIFSQSDDDKNAWSSWVPSFVSEPPIQELPSIPIENLNSSVSKNGTVEKTPELIRSALSITPISAQKSGSIRDKVSREEIASISELEKQTATLASSSSQQKETQAHEVIEFNFPSPPQFNCKSLSLEDAHQERAKILPGKHVNARVPLENQAHAPIFLPDDHDDVFEIKPGNSSVLPGENSRSPVSMRINSRTETPFLNAARTNARLRSRSLAHWTSNQPRLDESIINHRTSCSPRPPRVSSLLPLNKLHRIVEGDVPAVVSLANVEAKSSIPQVIYKQNPLDECRVFGARARILHVHRRSLSGTKVEWLANDNGVVEHANARFHEKRQLLRCLGDPLGRVDFFATDSVLLFRFQRTVGSTRTAASLDIDGGHIYFQVRDVSWDCGARWEVSLFDEVDRVAGTWLVTGDKQMQQLDVKEGGRILATIRDSGYHQYKVKVFPNTNWCIVIALCTLFDEWRAFRIGIAL